MYVNIGHHHHGNPVLSIDVYTAEKAHASDWFGQYVP